jgi:hypothetical protein
MVRQIKPVDANIVDFPPPVTDGQKEWEARLVAHLRLYLPEDQGEAREIIAVMKEAIERRSNGQLAWQRARHAAYILSMFPDDYRAAKRLVSLLSCRPGEDGA